MSEKSSVKNTSSEEFRTDAIGVSFAIGEITKEQATYLQANKELSLDHFSECDLNLKSGFM